MGNFKSSSGEVPRRKLGRTKEQVSALGLGGYSLGLVKSQREAIRIQTARISNNGRSGGIRAWSK